jgi:hypothetical protein
VDWVHTDRFKLYWIEWYLNMLHYGLTDTFLAVSVSVSVSISLTSSIRADGDL